MTGSVLLGNRPRAPYLVTSLFETETGVKCYDKMINEQESYILTHLNKETLYEISDIQSLGNMVTSRYHTLQHIGVSAYKTTIVFENINTTSNYWYVKCKSLPFPSICTYRQQYWRSGWRQNSDFLYKLETDRKN